MWTSGQGELEEFEKRLASAMEASLGDKALYLPELCDISWENIAKKVLL